MEAGRRLGPGTAALVFASARNPGGGFRTGARAQEEDVARASALVACQLTVPAFYDHHRSHPDLRYSDRVIHSPDVPVAVSSKAAGAVVELLKVLLKARAEEAGVASKLIATVSDLEQIANDDRADVGALKGWRREAFGEDALKLKRGELALVLDGARVAQIQADLAARS